MNFFPSFLLLSLACHSVFADVNFTEVRGKDFVGTRMASTPRPSTPAEGSVAGYYVETGRIVYDIGTSDECLTISKKYVVAAETIRKAGAFLQGLIGCGTKNDKWGVLVTFAAEAREPALNDAVTQAVEKYFAEITPLKIELHKVVGVAATLYVQPCATNACDYADVAVARPQKSFSSFFYGPDSLVRALPLIPSPTVLKKALTTFLGESGFARLKGAVQPGDKFLIFAELNAAYKLEDRYPIVTGQSRKIDYDCTKGGFADCAEALK